MNNFGHYRYGDELHVNDVMYCRLLVKSYNPRNIQSYTPISSTSFTTSVCISMWYRKTARYDQHAL